MTGRRLYDHYCDVAATQSIYGDNKTETPSRNDLPNTWSFLAARDKKVWNELARRISPKPRKRVAA